MYRPRNTYKSGQWLALCDRCGFTYYNVELKEEWNGLKVCKDCWEPRHPSDLFRARSESDSVPWARPDTANPAYGTIGDANTTLTVGTDENIQYASTTLTANRVIGLSTTNAQVGNQFIIYSNHGSAYTLNVVQGDVSHIDYYTDTAGNDLSTHTSNTGNTYSLQAGDDLVFSDSNRLRPGTASGNATYTVGSYTVAGTETRVIKAKLKYYSGDTTYYWRFGDPTDYTASQVVGVRASPSGGNLLVTLYYNFNLGMASVQFSTPLGSATDIAVKFSIDFSTGDKIVYGDFADGNTQRGSGTYNPTLNDTNFYLYGIDATGAVGDSAGTHLDYTVFDIDTIKELPASLDTRSVYEFDGTRWFLKDYQVIEV